MTQHRTGSRSAVVSGLARRLDEKAPNETDFSSRLRSPAVASRVGVWLGIAFAVTFLTGLYSHYSQEPAPPFWIPVHPKWLYRLTQGLHVFAGTAAIPLLLVKLWSVFPKLFARPPWGRWRELGVHGLERVSITVLVAAGIFQLVTGVANSTEWYPWSFSFRATHYAVAWIAIGALLVHIAVKLPTIRSALTGDVEDDGLDRPDTGSTSRGLSRRGLLRTTWVAAGLAALTTAGWSVPVLRRVAVFSPHTGGGPLDLPVITTASEADATQGAMSPDYRLTLAHGDRERSLTRADLERLPQHTSELPIACVEGWSKSATWTGVRMRDLVAMAGGAPGSAVLVSSLQQGGPFGSSRLPGDFAADPDTLLALRLNGEPLAIDHGYPARVIAPNRPGVYQTKWVMRLEVES